MAYNRHYIKLREKFYFRRVETASGARNFDRKGYWFHGWWPWRKIDFEKCGFVAKTTTLLERMGPERGGGNMPLHEDGLTPQELFPKCIIVRFFSKQSLNTVSLSGPGLFKLLGMQIWQRFKGDAWWISFMSLQSTMQERLDELREFVKTLLLSGIDSWNAPFGIELNPFCPNVRVDYEDFVHEAYEMAEILDELRRPLRIKLHAAIPPGTAAAILMHPAWDASVMGNTIPYGQLADKIPYEKLFGPRSPLEERGFNSPGGYAGPPLRDINCEWIHGARVLGVTQAIWGCGAIYHRRDVAPYAKAGADGIQIASAIMHSPLNVNPIIEEGYATAFDRAYFS